MYNNSRNMKIVYKAQTKQKTTVLIIFWAFLIAALRQWEREIEGLIKNVLILVHRRADKGKWLIKAIKLRTPWFLFFFFLNKNEIILLKPFNVFISYSNTIKFESVEKGCVKREKMLLITSKFDKKALDKRLHNWHFLLFMLFFSWTLRQKNFTVYRNVM